MDNKITNIKERVLQIAKYHNISYEIFCEDIGMTYGNFKGNAKNTPLNSDAIANILSKYRQINADWLMTGRGEMLTSSKSTERIELGTQPILAASPVGIPLIPIDAIAGFMTGNSEQVLEYECARYIIPAFRDAEFLIAIRGSSMYPKYNSGDIVACRKVGLGRFFQWNKVYVLDTEQGVLIKRIHESDKPNSIKLVSDNQCYKPFDVDISDIYSIAIVVGVIRVE